MDRRNDWSKFLPWNNSPGPSMTLEGEISCYSLPYGGLGIASHLLTYYTLVCLWKGRRPLLPWKNIQHGRIDVVLSSLGLIISSTLAAFTMVRCKNTWQLLVIAVWKLSMSILSGVTAVHVAILAWKAGAYEPVENPGGGWRQIHDREASYAGSTISSASRTTRLNTGKTAWWIILYIPGMVAGIVGLTSLIIKNKSNQAAMRVTIGFWCIVSAGFVVFALLTIQLLYQSRDSSGDGLATADTESMTSKAGSTASKTKGVVQMGMGAITICSYLFLILAALYGDLALGFLAHNLAGLPSGDNMVLFWSYFAAKRLSMFNL